MSRIHHIRRIYRFLGALAGLGVALGALLGTFGGVVTASPALARSPKWQAEPAPPRD